MTISSKKLDLIKISFKGEMCIYNNKIHFKIMITMTLIIIMTIIIRVIIKSNINKKCVKNCQLEYQDLGLNQEN